MWPAWFPDPSSFKEADFQPSWTYPAIGVSCYALAVFLLKQIPGKPLQMQTLSILHNIVMIAVSLVTGVFAFIAMRERYVLEGFDGIFCAQRKPSTTLDGPVGFWLKVYYLTKYYEFVDTFILCLKKKPTIPLHLYHHGIMPVLSWMWCRSGWLEGSIWCVVVNSWIHVMMYSYYLLAALGKKVWWRRHITQAQIVQFITGFVYVNIYFFQAAMRDCGATEKVYTALANQTVNMSFIALFLLFYKDDGKKQPKKNID